MPQSAVVDVTMKVGQTATEVAVQDLTPLLPLINATLGGTLERSRIEQLPINGRNVMTLLQTVPGMEGAGAASVCAMPRLRWCSTERRWRTDWTMAPLRAELRIGNRAWIRFRNSRSKTTDSSAKFTRPTSIIMTHQGWH